MSDSAPFSRSWITASASGASAAQRCTQACAMLNRSGTFQTKLAWSAAYGSWAALDTVRLRKWREGEGSLPRRSGEPAQGIPGDAAQAPVGLHGRAHRFVE